MRIVHFAPFAPCACGLYEAAKDMIAADFEAGHEVFFVDVGVTTGNGQSHTPGEPGKIDSRGFHTLVTSDPIVARTADVIIAHTGIPDPWISVCQAPIVWILHGRPTACFGPEQFGNGHSYSLLAQIAQWPRVKKMVTFWDQHMVYWKNIITDQKLALSPSIPVDVTRFSPNGPTHDFGELGGKINIMLADSWREDIDLYHVVTGILMFARENRGVKFHFYGVEQPLRCWDYILGELKDLGSLGEVWARRPNLEEVYRAADVVLSPHNIITRVIAESVCCGTPVIAGNNCVVSTWFCDTNDPYDIYRSIRLATNDIEYKGDLEECKELFSFKRYNNFMSEIYQEVL